MAALGFRLFAGTVRNAAKTILGFGGLSLPRPAIHLVRGFGSFWANCHKLSQPSLQGTPFGQAFNPEVSSGLLTNWSQWHVQQNRTVIKFSLQKGKRKTVKGVVRRFMFLNWGIWIRPKSGAHKKIWKKKWTRRQRLRRHVFVNGQQTRMLKHMTTNYWRRPRFYPDDPYTPYHARNNFKLRYPFR